MCKNTFALERPVERISPFVNLDLRFSSKLRTKEDVSQQGTVKEKAVKPITMEKDGHHSRHAQFVLHCKSGKRKYSQVNCCCFTFAGPTRVVDLLSMCGDQSPWVCFMLLQVLNTSVRLWRTPNIALAGFQCHCILVSAGLSAVVVSTLASSPGPSNSKVYTLLLEPSRSCDRVAFAPDVVCLFHSLQQMGPKEKKRFEDMATKDKERYNREMANYDGPVGGGKRKKKQKDPNAPKRAL